MRKSVFVLLAAMLTIGAVAPARADVDTFTFSDEYYINSLSMFHTVFGSSATGYGTAGIYQETNSATPVITKLSNGSNVPGEYVENTTPNAYDELALIGWSQSLNNGQQVGSVFNLNNPYNGAVVYFQYTVGGKTTPFTFDSFDLRGSFPSANLSFTLEGFLGGVLVDSAVLNVTGNTFSTYTENWKGVDTIEIVSTSSLPVNWGSGALYMDNVVIDTPEPASIALLSMMLIGLGVSMHKMRKRSGEANRR